MCLWSWGGEARPLSPPLCSHWSSRGRCGSTGCCTGPRCCRTRRPHWPAGSLRGQMSASCGASEMVRRGRDRARSSMSTTGELQAGFIVTWLDLTWLVCFSFPGPESSGWRSLCPTWSALPLWAAPSSWWTGLVRLLGLKTWDLSDYRYIVLWDYISAEIQVLHLHILSSRCTGRRSCAWVWPSSQIWTAIRQRVCTTPGPCRTVGDSSSLSLS